MQAQLAAQPVGAKTQGAGSGEYPLAGLQAHYVGACEGSCRRGSGNPGQMRYLFQISHGRSLEIDLIGDNSKRRTWPNRDRVMTVW
ncbi:hypothetical protein KUIN1_47000 [Pseudomonas sp. KUIN-1]|nr:hypothetical protein KUIN1_47000 [Pseudomonas sp. KUIN-1]